jgi:magnesium chelatase accessory protein
MLLSQRQSLNMSGELNWDTDGADWPHRQSSRFVTASGLRWHVQQMGNGPVLLLLHGTGAATHSWRGLAPLLAQHFTVIALDLPGHGFTETLPASRLSLSGMSAALHELLQSLNLQPQIVVGHSAGAAIGVRMSLDGYITPSVMVSLNGALLPPQGLPGLVFSPAAKLMAANPLVPKLFAWRAADRVAVQRLLASTGSTLEPEGVDLYARLVSNVTHVRGVLAMMANWNLSSIETDIARLIPPLLLVVGSNDGTVSPREASRVQRLLPSARIMSLAGLGHLAHEEQPHRVAELIMSLMPAMSATTAN